MKLHSYNLKLSSYHFTPVLEIMVFNTKYAQYTLMTKTTKKMTALEMSEMEKRASARALKQANKVAKMMGF